MFGNGYFKPSSYPFTAKAVNSLSVILAIIAGIVIGILRAGDFIKPKQGLMRGMFFLTVLMVWMLYVSLMPQEFKLTGGISFGLTESFYNNPVFFLILMISKSIVIYLWFRLTLTLAVDKLVVRNK